MTWLGRGLMALTIGRLLRPTWRRVLKILLPPVRRHIEQSAGVRERFGAACVDRIGVEDLVAKAEENTEPMLLPLDCIGAVLCFQLGLVSIIVFDRRDLLVVGGVKVVVEVAAK